MAISPPSEVAQLWMFSSQMHPHSLKPFSDACRERRIALALNCVHKSQREEEIKANYFQYFLNMGPF